MVDKNYFHKILKLESAHYLRNIIAGLRNSYRARRSDQFPLQQNYSICRQRV